MTGLYIRLCYKLLYPSSEDMTRSSSLLVFIIKPRVLFRVGCPGQTKRCGMDLEIAKGLHHYSLTETVKRKRRDNNCAT